MACCRGKVDPLAVTCLTMASVALVISSFCRARAGVGRIRLIDFDQVTLSSLNRHATATREDVGISKVSAMARSIARITPSCVVEPVQQIFSAEHADTLLAGNPDYVLDCIDDKETKGHLLLHCKRNGLRVLCSLGAGGKADPTRLVISDLVLVRHDPLGAAIRQHLRRLGALPKAADDGRELLRAQKQKNAAKSAAAAGDDGVEQSTEPGTSAGGKQNSKKKQGADDDGDDDSGAVVLSGIPCLYSSELPRIRLLPLKFNPAAGETPQDFGALPGFRIRVMPVLGTMPAIFGQAMASYVLCALAGPSHAIEPFSAIPTSANTTKKIQSNAAMLDNKNFPKQRGWGIGGGVSLDEADFLCNDAWHQRSPVSNIRLSTKGIIMQLARWKPWLGSVPSNTVLLLDEEVKALLAATMANGIPDLIESLSNAQAEAAAAEDSPAPRVSSSVSSRALDSIFDVQVRSIFGDKAVDEIENRLRWVREQGWA